MKIINLGTSRDDLAARIEKYFPIKTKTINNITTRIHEQYPAVDRIVVSNIVHKFFVVVRDELLAGKIINLLKYLPSMGIFTYYHNDLVAIKTKIKTPESLR